MRKNNIRLIIRGLRMSSDFAYEFQMHCVNHKLDSNIETIFLASLEHSQFISSSFVKEVLSLGGDISKFVSSNIAEKLSNKIGYCLRQQYNFLFQKHIHSTQPKCKFYNNK